MEEIIKKLSADFSSDIIKWKVQAQKGAWTTFVSFVDSRAVTKHLDDATGGMWQDKFENVNGLLICSIGIWDANTKQWIWRCDTGTGSDIEKEKGHVSDAFKRSAVKWGVGRGLYSSPVVKVKNDKGGKATYKGSFIHDATGVCNELVNANKGKSVVFWDDEKNSKTTNPAVKSNAGKGIDKEVKISLLVEHGTPAQRGLAAKLLSSSKFDAIRDKTVKSLNNGAKDYNTVIDYLQLNIAK